MRPDDLTKDFHSHCRRCDRIVRVRWLAGGFRWVWHEDTNGSECNGSGEAWRARDGKAEE